MNGNEAFDRSRPETTAATTSRERGPATANCAQWSVTSVSTRSRCAQCVCRWNSRCSSTARAVGGRRRHEEVLGCEPGSRAVVEQDAVVAQHDAVAATADRERRECIRVDEIEEARGIRAANIDLAERRHVGDADGATHGARFLQDRIPAGLLRVDERAQPQTRRHEGRAGGFVPVVEGSRRFGLKCMPTSGPANAEKGVGCT